jgi:hypothetical protein
MTDDNDLADFELVLVNANGDEELAAACSGPRETALIEILTYFSQFPNEERRLYEVTRIRVDLSAKINEPEPSRLILPAGLQ